MTDAGAVTRERFAEWRRTVAAGRKIALIALQPGDTISQDGASGGRSPERVLMESLATLPEGWVAIATCHPIDRAAGKVSSVSAAGLRQAAQPAVRPQGGARSDDFITAVDGVICVTSKVGLLAGKPVVTLGPAAYSTFCETKVSAMGTAPLLERSEIARLLLFLANSYNFTFAEIFQTGHFMHGVFAGLLANADKAPLLVPTDRWTPEALTRLF